MIGYLIGSHVIYQSVALPPLLDSLLACGIDPGAIVVAVNGSFEEHYVCDQGSHFFFQTGELPSHFAPVITQPVAERFGISHFFYLNCTGRAGPNFKRLVEEGFDHRLQAQRAGPVLGGWDNRGCINDLAMYQAMYLRTLYPHLGAIANASPHELINQWEGWYWLNAEQKGNYPRCNEYSIDCSNLVDVYDTGSPRATEYFAAVDWHRYKRNWGQLPIEDAAKANV